MDFPPQFSFDFRPLFTVTGMAPRRHRYLGVRGGGCTVQTYFPIARDMEPHPEYNNTHTYLRLQHHIATHPVCRNMINADLMNIFLREFFGRF